MATQIRSFASSLVMKRLLIVACLSGVSAVVFGGGIRGSVKGEDGNALAFATIYVKQTGSGAVTDMQGHYEVVLSPGHYEILYPYLGFETESRSIDVGNAFIEINVTLKT